MITINDPKKPVILCIPEAGIYPYMRGLAVLGDAVMKTGGKVFVTRDSGQMLRSPIMAMYQMPVTLSQKDRDKVSRQNDKLLEMVEKKYGFSIIELSDFFEEELKKEIDALDNTDDLESISYRGFPVGKIAHYDFILETKFRYSAELPDDKKMLYRQYIKNTALTIALMDRICEHYDPSLLLTFNEYAQCQAVRYSAETHGVGRMAITYPTHFNADASKIMIWKTTCEYWRYRHCQNWNQGKDIPIATEAVEACWKDTVFRLYGIGSHIFSSRKSNNTELIFKELNLDSRKKTVVVYTSSQDERLSVETAMAIWNEDNDVQDAFSNQIEWLEFLREFAKKRNDVQIVVRIHPREGAIRSGPSSEHLTRLKEIFVDNTENFVIVWPENPISSYDLMELADACLVAWSLMGQEAARLGIPVLSFTGNMFYPDDDFMQVAVTKNEYEERLVQLLYAEYTWQHLVKAIRFYHWRIFVPSLDIGETVSVGCQDDTMWPEAPARLIPIIHDILSDRIDLISYNIETWKKGLSDKTIQKESAAVACGIRMFLHTVFYPPVSYEQKFGIWLRLYRKAKKETDKLYRKITRSTFSIKEQNTHTYPEYALEYTEDSSHIEELCLKTRKDKSLRIMVRDGMDVTLLSKGKKLHRRSPLAGRLAKLHESYVKEIL